MSDALGAEAPSRVSYATDPDAYESMLSDIAAGAALHYEDSDSPDPDFDLLRGDERYAEGLVKLAALGDLQATRILGDAISAIAQARAAGDVAAARAVWEQAVEAVRTKR
jgi:hypothetical protein